VSIKRSTGIKRARSPCPQRGHPAHTSRRAPAFPYKKTRRHPHSVDCFVMSIDGLNNTPAEFVRLHSDAYNVRSVTKEGVSYYESYHYEQIRDFFALEHHLRQGNFPDRIPGGYDAFCQAFERDAKCKKLTKVSFATINYDGPDPTSILVNEDSRSPTIQDVLGPDADLRSQWEKKGVRRMTDEEDEVLRQIALKHMSDGLRIDRLKKRAFDEREDKHSRKGLRTPGS